MSHKLRAPLNAFIGFSEIADHGSYRAESQTIPSNEIQLLA
jgi:signal transduction histidine kinase